MLITIGRIIKSGFKNFWRNGYLSVAVIFIIILTLLVFSGIILINEVGKFAIENLEKRVDVSVYLKNNAEESEILDLKSKVEGLGEVDELEYITKEEALKRFKEEYRDNSIIQESLAELDINPLPPTFNIRAKALDQYGSIIGFLENSGNEAIAKINYAQNKDVIDRLNRVVDTSKKAAAVLGIIFGVAAILITFNTIRLTIYSHRQEIEIMRLVGAGNWYIRMPFIVEGALYGVFGVVITLAILYPSLMWATPYVEGFIPGVNLMTYFSDNLLSIVLVQFSVGVGVGVLSSAVAVRRYLKV